MSNIKRLIITLLLIFAFFACLKKSDKEPTVFRGTQMTIDYVVQVGDVLTERQSKIIQHLIKEVFNDINRIYNKWNPYSELSKLNQLKAYEKVKLSQELEKLLVTTGHIVKLTGGRFDPTIEPLQALWKKHLESNKLAPASEIVNLKPALGWDKIHIENGYFYKDHDLTSLDLGGIAKGYGVDLLIEKIRETGINNVYVEWGGEIRTAGEHPANRPWNIFISNLGDLDPKKALDIVSLSNEAIATSGDYLQFWNIAEENSSYTHIIHPKTLKPLKITDTSIASVSVIAPSCTLADALATSLMLFPTVEKAKKFALKLKKQRPELKFWIMSRSLKGLHEVLLEETDSHLESAS